MIGRNGRFGRSAGTVLSAAVCIAACWVHGVSAIGSTGWFATRVKFEYQYTDYNEYRYPDPIPPSYPDVEYTRPDPYIADFPETRTLVRVTQAFGPTNVLQLRYQYSDLTDTKRQNLYYVRFARDVTQVTSLYAVYQVTELPDWFSGYMVTLGAHHDRSGWILGDWSASYFRNRAADGNLVETLIPSFQLRYSIDGMTALTGRWEAYWARGGNGKSTANVWSLFLSRYLPTQTAVHVACRLYDNSGGVRSWAPMLEVAQYIRWNLTLRMTYRYYTNEIEDPEIKTAIEGDGVRSHSVRGYLEWQIGSDLKIHIKLRRYVSNQHVEMNTYLLGFEYML